MIVNVFVLKYHILLIHNDMYRLNSVYQAIWKIEQYHDLCSFIYQVFVWHEFTNICWQMKCLTNQHPLNKILVELSQFAYLKSRLSKQTCQNKDHAWNQILHYLYSYMTTYGSLFTFCNDHVFDTCFHMLYFTFYIFND